MSKHVINMIKVVIFEDLYDNIHIGLQMSKHVINMIKVVIFEDLYDNIHVGLQKMLSYRNECFFKTCCQKK